MSHIGCGNNITQPTGQCFGCKYWKPARKTLFLSTSGHCTLSYCKKNSIYNRRLRNATDRINTAFFVTKLK